MYLQNTVSIDPISSYPKCDMVPKDELSRSSKLLFLNKNPFLVYFIYSMTGTWGIYVTPRF
ncbi:hypothetical protein Lalb_Chr25g0281961 [Lupinus albus]|uniref:Ycf2 N-terminal domain-containing protein n=1 Tax=Lupinus albus TaxID=3870 RepID=A0A6A4MU88_LUPAL|nr:hypothetical protein Lalb_Chr25g0281961 [Lupinus albus]